jgi:hypothetical protein
MLSHQEARYHHRFRVYYAMFEIVLLDLAEKQLAE